ncbi:MAG: Rap1a/Tai family immunity protein [Terriglobales bacterium]|jgi:hypothetical protein
MKQLMLFCFGLLLCITPAHAGVLEHDNGWGGMDGNDLLPLCQAQIEFLDGKTLSPSRTVDASECMFYIEGFLDGFWARDNAPIPNTTTVLCYPEGVNTGQMIRVITKWLQDHPARLHEPAWSCIFAAAHDAFACRPAKETKF